MSEETVGYFLAGMYEISLADFVATTTADVIAIREECVADVTATTAVSGTDHWDLLRFFGLFGRGSFFGLRRVIVGVALLMAIVAGTAIIEESATDDTTIAEAIVENFFPT